VEDLVTTEIETNLIELDLIKTLATGVPGLDETLGGGLPELSFNLIAGGPGSGKTTMAMQIMFANATAARPGLFFTVLGEPPLKLLRYQQQFSFFGKGRVGSDVHFVNLSAEVLAGDLTVVLDRIVAEIESVRPGIVVIDSFRSLVNSKLAMAGLNLELEHFVQRLAFHLTTLDITSFLIGEYVDQELRNPVFTVADGIIWLFQAVDRNSVVRKLQVLKMRGLSMMPGLHTLRLTKAGVQVFPRMLEVREDEKAPPEDERNEVKNRVSFGIRGLDEMMGGGVPAGDSVVIAGPTGTGKTTFAMQFVAEGLRRGETSVIAVFEERPREYLARGRAFGVDFPAAVRENKLRIIYVRPLDLSVDETLEEISKSVREIGAKRVVIDSISGFEMALAPTFREDFRESLYRLVSALTGLGVTVVLTVEVIETDVGLRFTNYGVSFLTDDILVQRYVEIEGQLRKVLVIVKMRGSRHSRDFRAYEITGNGILMGELLREYDGIVTGVPTLPARLRIPSYPGLNEEEMRVLQRLVEAGGENLESLVAITGLGDQELLPILDRLLQLGYVSRTDGPDGTATYQGLARMSTA
jgi:circadian clock protein KaiC